MSRLEGMEPLGRRAHAARVALATAAIVAAGYALCAFGLGEFVNHRLVAEADSRLQHVLSDVVRGRLTPAAVNRADGDQDSDNERIFEWKVAATGVAQPLTIGAPALARRSWTTAPVTVTVQATSFRLDSVRYRSLWVVAGQSVSTVGRVDAALLQPEFVFGLLLILAVFTGAFAVGLRASAPLEQVRRRQAEFTADASHELRTPLSVVEAEVDLALRRTRNPSEYQAVLERIGDEGRRLRRIVDDLLWLARADAGAVDPQRGERADVAEIAESCVDRFQALAEQRGVTLCFDQEGDGAAVVQAAPEWVDRLTGVLIDNACKYAGADGYATATVSIGQGRVVLRVDDSGPGIPPEERAAVFDRFHRATTEAGGAGLGLAIADSVVRMSGASWTVTDSPLGGARLAVAWRKAPARSDAPGRPDNLGRSEGAADAAAHGPGALASHAHEVGGRSAPR